MNDWKEAFKTGWNAYCKIHSSLNAETFNIAIKAFEAGWDAAFHMHELICDDEKLRQQEINDSL